MRKTRYWRASLAIGLILLAATAHAELAAIDDQAIVVVHSGQDDPLKPPCVDAGQPAARQVREIARDRRSRRVEVSWQETHWHLPATAQNLGDPATGAEPSDCSVKLPQPTAIDAIIIRTVGELVYGRNRCGIRDYQVRCHLPAGGWVTLGEVHNNTKARIVHLFNPLVVDRVALDVAAYNRDKDLGLWKAGGYPSFTNPFPPPSPRIELYRLASTAAKPQESAKTREVSIEESSKGRIAIFKDKVPMPEGVPSSPDAIAATLRMAGYGVTFLDAELLSRTPLLSKEYFDLFIHPYGCSFPMGTTLYQFLEKGGHLLTLGGRPFTVALDRRSDGALAATGLDPGLITTPATMPKLDCYEPSRDQLGIFAAPFQVLEHAASARAAEGQKVIDPAVRVNRPLSGYPAIGLVGQVVPIEEEERYVRQGKELPYILKARAVIKQTGRFHSILEGDHNYLTFNKACARWMPLLETQDRFGRPRGAAAAMLLNHDGIYAGSTWTFFGVTNCDLFSPDNETLRKALVDIVDFQLRTAFLHGFRPDFDCYRQGEPAKVRVFAANFGPSRCDARLTFSYLPRHTDKAVFQQEQTVTLERNQSTLVEARWAPPQFDLDFYRIRCTLEVDGKVIDQMESGLVVWNEEAMRAESAFRVNYHDNYFHDGDRPLFVVGSRSDGLNRVGQHGEDPLAWDRRLQQMQDFGMSVFSPVFLQMYLPGADCKDPSAAIVPEEILRQMDAQAQLCQRHKLIFAPNLFFEHRDDALSDIDHSACIVKLLGDRYCRVPGMIFYLWDDGLGYTKDKASSDRFLELTRRCTEALATNPAQRPYVTTAEMMDSNEISTRRSLAHLTFGHHVYRTCDQFAPARLADLRAAGRSCGCGEFYHWPAARDDDAIHRYYLDVPHNFFAMGYSWILNWKWNDADAVIFPWGVVSACDGTPKPVAYTYRNLSWFLRSFRPTYVQPELMFVVPMAYWERSAGAQGDKGLDDLLSTMLGKVMSPGHVNLGVVDDLDLPRLAPTTKALIHPWALCQDEKTYAWLCDFVRRGGRAYLTGDLSYEPQQKNRRLERLKELAGVEPREAATDPTLPQSLRQLGARTSIRPVVAYGDWKEPYDGRVALPLRLVDATAIAVDGTGNPVVVRHRLGKGEVVFNADLSSDAPASLIRAFLADAQIDPIRTIPDRPDLIRVFRVPTEDGQVFGITSKAEQPEVTVAGPGEPVTLRVARSPMVMAGFDRQGRLTSCESDGLVRIGDRTVVQSDVSTMIFTLDNKPLEESGAVVVLPQPFARAAVRLAVSASLDHLTIGDVENAIWHTRREDTLTRDAKGATFAVDPVESLSVVLLTRQPDRDKYVKQLSRLLSGYLE